MLKFSEYRKVMELKNSGVRQNKVVRETGYTLHSVFLCKKQDPDTKGKVENAVKFVKTSFLESREYSGIDNLNREGLAWLDRTGNGTVNINTRKTPRELFEIESQKLIKTVLDDEKTARKLRYKRH